MEHPLLFVSGGGRGGGDRAPKKENPLNNARATGILEHSAWREHAIGKKGQNTNHKMEKQLRELFRDFSSMRNPQT